MLIPLGLEDSRVDRVPWISIALAVLMVVILVVLQSAPDPYDDAIEKAARFWVEHPYLQVPEPLEARLPLIFIRQVQELGEEATPPVGELYALQAELDSLGQRVVEGAEESPWWRLALVPARGLLQRGWLTSIFIHFGWLHLLGNLLFFYITAPFIEDRWGRPLFLGFFLLGGVVAAAAHVGLDPHSEIMLGGASGAIAACLGAFAFRLARQRVRVLLWVVIPLARFSIPAWLWSPLWFVFEVAQLRYGATSSGVAVMAHVGGWLFGFGFATLLAILQIEARFIEPALQRALFRRAENAPRRPPVAPAPIGPIAIGLLVSAVALGVVAAIAPDPTDRRPTGAIRVASEPEGAQIWVNGRDTGARTPSLIEGLRLGRAARIAVQLERHQSDPPHEDVLLNRDHPEREVRFHLQRVRSLRIESEPSGASVELDRRAIGLTPVTTPPLPVGRAFEAELSLDGHLPVKLALSTAAGSATVTWARFEPSRSLQIDSDPGAATVRVDGLEVGVTPAEIFVPRARAFRLEVTKPGFRAFDRRLKPREVGRALELRLKTLPFRALPLSADDRRAVAALEGKVARLSPRRALAQRRLVQAEARHQQLERQGADLYRRAEAERARDEAQADFDALDEERRAALDELEALRGRIVEALSR